MSRRGRGAAAGALLLLFLPAAGAEDRPAPPAAVVGGRTISRAEVADFLYDRRREAWLETVDDLVDDRIALEDAARWRIEVPGPVLDAAVEAEATARASQVKQTYGEGLDLAALVRDAYDLDLPSWRAWILRPRLRAQLLLQRVVRADGHRRPLVEARVIVLEDAARAAEVERKVSAGADFGLVALHESKDPSAKQGGTLPPIARGDLIHREVEEALFAAAPGAVVGPLPVRVEGRPQWHLYRVVRRVDPWAGDPAAWGAALERDLAERPAQRAEFLAWRRRVRRERDVRLYAPDGSPLRSAR